ncbi:hypothetical protein SAMN05661109_02206 [Corynebacterium cystitidis DSM 20524]|uniref:PPE family protein n=2 Tax=Corynebacterium cystitidis TaxID=35757 RepID=A0A1H9VEP6_9CORY|nr:hypothetical protein SAMN05661109_02206 [Corynebacterium cystitidis DSM 20524]
MLNFDPVEVLAAAQKLETSGQFPVGTTDSEESFLTISYSSVSGLSEVGQMHATILSTNGQESVQAFTDRFVNAATTLRRNVADVVNGDEAFAAALEAYQHSVSVGAQLGMRGLTSSPLADIPVGSITNTDTQPLVVVPPVVVRPPSLVVLAGQFASTNHGVPSSMAGDWTSLASKVRSAADSLDEVLGDLESSAETEAIQLAMATIRTIQSTGYTFASNADSLATNTTSLATAGQAQAQQAAQVAYLYGLANATSPVLARTIEQSYLESFPPAMTTTLGPALPSVGQLLPPMDDPHGGSAGEVTPSGRNPGRSLPVWEDTALPAVVQEAMEHYGMGEAARMRDPQELAAEFQRSGADTLDAVMAGHVPTSTAAASAAAPVLPPPLHPGAHSGALASPTPPATTAATTPAAGQFGPLPPSGTAMAHTRPGTRLGTTGPGAGVGAPGAAGVVRPGSGPGSGVRPLTTGIGGRTVVGTDSGGRAGGGKPPSGAGSGGLGGHGSSGVSRGSAGGLGAGSSAHAAHGGTPVGGMMGAGRGAAGTAGGRRGNHGSGSVRGIKTSAVEREGNLKALLGEGPEVIPGVIGAWVREPRTDR